MCAEVNVGMCIVSSRLPLSTSAVDIPHGVWLWLFMELTMQTQDTARSPAFERDLWVSMMVRVTCGAGTWQDK